MINFFAFVIVLGVLVFFHEFGHFIVARLFGVGVEKFSLGFGPRLFGKTVGITDYRVSAIPLGGYVKMVGEEPDADIAPEDIPISFTHKHVAKRILIVVAGPLFNLFLAVIIYFGFFQIYGVFVLKPSVGEIQEGSPAYEAGLQEKDLIVGIDGVEVELWEDMVKIISSSEGRNLEISVRRGEENLVFHITPKLKIEKLFGVEVRRYLIGIKSGDDGFRKSLNPLQAFSESINLTYEIATGTLGGIVRLIKGSESPKSIGGPILIAQMAGFYAKKGMIWLIEFIAQISIVLGVLNLLPIPVLDGGHLVFFLIEAVKGSPVNTRIREIAIQVGMLALFLLMIYVFYNDIARIVDS